jgi:hypothetical protein
MGQPKFETLAERVVYAKDGMPWRVREALAHDVPGAGATSCLIFDGGYVVRRIWHFPSHWTRLSDTSLLEIINGPR